MAGTKPARPSKPPPPRRSSRRRITGKKDFRPASPPPQPQCGHCTLCADQPDTVGGRSARTLQGRPLITMWAPLRMRPACMGNVSDAPESVDSNVSACSSSDMVAGLVCVGGEG